MPMEKLSNANGKWGHTNGFSGLYQWKNSPIIPKIGKIIKSGQNDCQVKKTDGLDCFLNRWKARKLPFGLWGTPRVRSFG
jgi:hypothetical protein